MRPQPARPAELPPHGPLGQLGRSQDPRGAIAAWPPWRGPRDVSEDVAPAAAPPAGPGEGRAGRHSRCSTRNGKAAPGQTLGPTGDTGAAGPHGLGRPRGALAPLDSAPAWGQQSLYAFVSLSKWGVCSGLSHGAPQLAHRSTGGDGLSPGRTAPSASLGPVSGRLHGAWGF